MQKKSPKPEQDRKAIIAWCIYDWACSSYSSVIITFIFATYFTQKIAINQIVGTVQWASAGTISGLLIALLSPIVGAIADYRGRRKPWLGLFSGMAILAAVGLWFALPEAHMVLPVLIMVVIGSIGIEVGAVFYNAMLADLAPANFIGRISGWAWGMGYFGGLVSLGIMLMIVQGHITWFHFNHQQFEQVRICGPLVGLWLFLFMLPLFLLVPDRAASGLSMRESINQGLYSLWDLLRRAHAHKQIFKFLLARMIYTDGLNTLFAFGGIYAAGTMHMNIAEVIQFGIVLNLAAGIGAVILAWMDDLRGSKFTILFALGLMMIFGLALLLTYSHFWFWVFAIGVSLCVGPVQAASRSYMVHIAPAESVTEFFGLYALSGRATAFVGPWVLGIVTLYFHSQRAGMATVFIFIAVGALLLAKVKRMAVMVKKSDLCLNGT